MSKTGRRAIMIAGVGLLTGMSGCSGDDPLGPASPAPPDGQAMMSRVGIALLAAAMWDEGGGPFDNAIPCPRRGVIAISNTNSGRLATFSGCDLGAGVIAEGSGAIDWVGPGLQAERAEFCVIRDEPGCADRLTWTGALQIRDGASGSTPVLLELTHLDVDDVAMTYAGGLFPPWMDLQTFGLGFESMRVGAAGNVYPVADPDLPRMVFDIGDIRMGDIANPANSLGALSEADVKRLAYHTGMAMAYFLVDESLDPSIGEHTHETFCGLSGVMFHAVTGLPVITIQWSDCPAGGVVIDGTYVTVLVEISEAPGRLVVQIDGPLRLGGGVPDVNLSGWTWVMEERSGAPGAAVLSGTMRTRTGESRTYEYELILDD